MGSLSHIFIPLAASGKTYRQFSRWTTICTLHLLCFFTVLIVIIQTNYHFSFFNIQYKVPSNEEGAVTFLINHERTIPCCNPFNKCRYIVLLSYNVGIS